MGTFEDAVKSVRAALEAGADPATRQQAAAALRSLLAALEAPAEQPGGAAPASADVLGALIEKLRPLVPPDVKIEVPRLNIPLVPLPKR